MAAADDVVSGKYACAKKGDLEGVVADSESILEITAWQYSEASEDVTYASCETDGQRKRVDGNYDITGTLTVAYNASEPFRTQVPVDSNLVLYLFKRKPMIGVAGIYDRIPAKILGISGGANINQAGVQEWTVSWGYNVTADDPIAEFDQAAPALPAP